MHETVVWKNTWSSSDFCPDFLEEKRVCSEHIILERAITSAVYVFEELSVNKTDKVWFFTSTKKLKLTFWNCKKSADSTILVFIFIVHSIKLCNSDSNNEMKLIPNCTLREYKVCFGDFRSWPKVVRRWPEYFLSSALANGISNTNEQGTCCMPINYCCFNNAYISLSRIFFF